MSDTGERPVMKGCLSLLQPPIIEYVRNPDSNDKYDTLVRVPCNKCKRYVHFKVRHIDLTNQASGVNLIQRNFPYLTSDERNIMQCGLCAPCWDDVMGKEE